MSAGLLTAMLAGALLCGGLAALVMRLFPAQHVALDDAFARITPTTATASAAPSADVTRKDRFGAWALRTMPPALWVRTPVRELALLQIPVTRFYADKLIVAGLGLIAVPAATALYAAMGLRLPVTIPAVASLALAALLFFTPNAAVARDAKQARGQFRRALALYLDLVAVERRSGAGVRPAMEAAADVADSWVFRRLGEVLRRTQWSGQPPWDALEQMADELGLPELKDFADIVGLSATQGAAAYDHLRARSAALRSAILSEDLTAANNIGERMAIPSSLLGVIFMALLIAPAVLRMALPT
ncbi:type II secretion system protein [Xylanimonas cellulosilytica DSM 15894]|uniref:Type II secretion system protein n=1 Tax=Xylanimonas cellulosilytica (strain DSM 15894 / JCM 12276 / CECT 5975 / KCTC 9989 / LMG 20990 / NBRC 107835 / XIL07) TaxID=446471 RepID=D1BY31_XYLCX|nr:membrane protein [Xylanimonas cellulosilytica]ACZ29874.1 type II secretion system protein [Xylanimonas cellulosilytica DSM 15894]